MRSLTTVALKGIGFPVNATFQVAELRRQRVASKGVTYRQTELFGCSRVTKTYGKFLWESRR